MSRRVSVHLLPSLIPAGGLSGGCAVVLDVLRATTTICQALSAGARAVIPCLEIDDVHRAAERFPREQLVLGGERNCLPIAGFDLGNSPAEYTAEKVQGRTVIISTTNGTAALQCAASADRVVAGALVNLSTVVLSVLKDSRPVHVVCAGTHGMVTAEDVLCAGALVSILSRELNGTVDTNDSARMASGWYRQVVSTGAGGVPTELRRSQGGRNLLAVGQQADIETAAEIDSLNILPEWNHEAGELVAASA